MTWILPLLMFLIVFACVATLYTEGMWSNAISLINVVTAALLATNFFEPVARWLEGMQASYTYVWDFLALWGLFGLFMIVLRALTDQLSKVRVRFLKIADRIGSGLLSVWIGWVMVCFTMMTLHTAPLARNFLFEGFQPENKMIFSLAPDRQWLGFTQKMSMGAYSQSATPAERERYVFDPTGSFMPKYATRRANLEGHIAQHDTLRVLGK